MAADPEISALIHRVMRLATAQRRFDEAVARCEEAERAKDAALRERDEAERAIRGWQTRKAERAHAVAAREAAGARGG